MKKPTKKSDRLTLDDLLFVQIREPKQNPMFTEFQHQVTRFLIYNRPVACAACGKKKRTHWTQLCEFQAMDMSAGQFVLKRYPPTFAPLTPVCTDHPISPDYDKAEQAMETRQSGKSAPRSKHES